MVIMYAYPASSKPAVRKRVKSVRTSAGEFEKTMSLIDSFNTQPQNK
jgi:hypothetical protein